jgi:hypothetical protein
MEKVKGKRKMSCVAPQSLFFFSRQPPNFFFFATLGDMTEVD